MTSSRRISKAHNVRPYKRAHRPRTPFCILHYIKLSGSPSTRVVCRPSSSQDTSACATR